MPFKKFLRRNIYKWHRITSLLIALPVLLWTVSGFLHPIMNSFKPDVKSSLLPPTLIDSSKISVPLKVALEMNGITIFQNFRVVKLYNGFYYQVQPIQFDSLTYITCESGNILQNGDKHYASYLAQRFLAGDNGSQELTSSHHHIIAPTMALTATTSAMSESDIQPTKINSAKLISSFNKNYKAGNKILPVYEISFERKDGIKLYIETKADRLAFAADDNKRWFSAFFGATHSWTFLNGAGKIKTVLLGTFSALCFLSSIFGFIVYNVLNRKKKPSAKNRSRHRLLGNIFLLTTLLYAFSGAWHAFAKLPGKPAIGKALKSSVPTKETDLNLRAIYSSLGDDEKLTGLSVVNIQDSFYWQVGYQKGKLAGTKYVNTTTNHLLVKGDEKYSAFLAARYKGIPQSKIQTTRPITAFTHSYSMMNKRLPVMENKLVNGESIYVETSTGNLAAITSSSEKTERFSFSNLHMHHYWEMWLGKKTGKTAKNIFLVATTLGLLLLAMTGMLVYIRKKFARKQTS